MTPARRSLFGDLRNALRRRRAGLDRAHPRRGIRQSGHRAPRVPVACARRQRVVLHRRRPQPASRVPPLTGIVLQDHVRFHACALPPVPAYLGRPHRDRLRGTDRHAGARDRGWRREVRRQADGLRQRDHAEARCHLHERLRAPVALRGWPACRPARPSRRHDRLCRNDRMGDRSASALRDARGRRSSRSDEGRTAGGGADHARRESPVPCRCPPRVSELAVVDQLSAVRVVAAE